MNTLPKWVWVVVVLVVLIGGWMLLKGNKAPKVEGAVTIGVSAPLTGEAASYGEWIKAGIDLAVKEVNDAGGVNGQPVQVIYEDDKCNQTGANVFQKFTAVDRVTAIIGPICSAAAGPGIPIAENARIPAIIWGSAPDLPVGKDFIFRSYPSDSFQGKYSAEYIFNELGKKQVAVVYTKNDWGQGLRDTFIEEFTKLGGTVVYEEGVTQDATDLRTVMAKVKAANPEFIYIPLYPANAILAVKEMKTLGMTQGALGGDALESEEFLSVPEAEGVLISSAHFNNPDDFKARIKAATGKDSGFATPLAYDTFNLLINVIKEVGTNPDAIREGLAKANYEGISLGKFSFDNEGDLASAEFDIKTIHKGKAEVTK